MIHTYLLSIVSFLLFSNVALAQHATKIKERYNYSLYLPKNYATSDTLLYPLVIYLHGGSQRGDDLTKLKAYGPPYMVDKGHEYNFIIASPQCPEDRYWTTNDWFDLLYTELKKNTELILNGYI